MTRRYMTILAALLSTGAAFAQNSPVAGVWGDLSAQVNGKKVALMLPDGTEIHGKVKGVQADGLQIDISKTSNKKIQPKGLQLIPKQSVSVLRVNADRKIGRVVCTVGAAAAVAAIAATVAYNGTGISEGVGVIVLPAVAAAGTVGAGVGGYFIGRAIDRRETIVRVIP